MIKFFYHKSDLLTKHFCRFRSFGLFFDLLRGNNINLLGEALRHHRQLIFQRTKTGALFGMM